MSRHWGLALLLVAVAVVGRPALGQDAGEPARGYLGIRVRPALHGEPFIDQVAPGSPADKAGLQRGDQIVEFNGTRVSDFKQYRAAVEGVTVKPGDRVTFRVARGDGKEVTVTVTAAERPRKEQGP